MRRDVRDEKWGLAVIERGRWKAVGWCGQIGHFR
jgi:hypothetical protein